MAENITKVGSSRIAVVFRRTGIQHLNVHDHHDVTTVIREKVLRNAEILSDGRFALFTTSEYLPVAASHAGKLVREHDTFQVLSLRP